MKIIKVIIGLIYLPILALAGLIAIVRLILVLIFVFAWDKSGDWYADMICWINDNVANLKEDNEQGN